MESGGHEGVTCTRRSGPAAGRCVQQKWVPSGSSVCRRAGGVIGVRAHAREAGQGARSAARLGGVRAPTCSRGCCAPAEVDGCAWSLEGAGDARLLVVTIEKLTPGTWPSLVKSDG